MSFPTPRTTAVIERVLETLDYAALAPIYCEFGGDAFWAAHRGPVRELGLKWAAAAGPRLKRGGRSLYVGAGVAELPVLLAEVLDLDRECAATNLRADECAVLNRALELGDAGGLRFQPVDAAVACSAASYDHLGFVNVADDPQSFPNVSAVTYGRASVLDLDAAAFERERAAVRALVAAVCAALATPGLVTTTFEEAPWFIERAAACGARVHGDDTMIETALVGDPIGFLRWEMQ